jgi:hypothetical protein
MPISAACRAAERRADVIATNYLRTNHQPTKQVSATDPSANRRGANPLRKHRPSRDFVYAYFSVEYIDSA